MKKSFKYRAVNALIMNIPIALAISLTAQLLAIHTVIPQLLLINFIIAYAVSFVVGVTLPCVGWGIGFANFCKTKPNTLPFGLCINAVVNLTYVVINSLILTYFNVVILNHAPIIAYFIGMATTFIPIYIVGYIVSFLWNRPAEKMTESICGNE
ncbi:hypothetical protein [Butyrivibrio sp. INlla16]|uniref:hypothetical protein n=1 Tax=Butyrivibrio sp. INlla16 TaxID=1520807 RepID=UPI000889C0A7|nr:hypothetical protein [Butyrivibrio sp. INlla16]SDB26584.1 hypothetical protein SAMN02910263_01266 [Butyrivibrio sp. INlla16]